MTSELSIDLDELLSALGEGTRKVLASNPTVEEVSDPAVDEIGGQESSTWLQIPDVVAVVADLRNSSQLGTGRHVKTTAKIYQAAVEGAVQCLHAFDAQFIDIQGDGGFGLFWGGGAYERAFCAAVTIRSYSKELVDQLTANDTTGTLPETGYKVGIAADRLLVKTIGTRRELTEQEAVWPGRALNHAVKCAQSAERHQIIVTERVFDHFKDNDYVTVTCGCSNGEPGDVADLWTQVTIDHIADEDRRDGYRLEAPWCSKHGADFCRAILNGETSRNLDQEKIRALHLPRLREALRQKKETRPRYPR